METTIRSDSNITTLINIFTVEPQNQAELVALLKEGTEAWISKLPGFISSNFHNSSDGRRLVIYGQWRSPEAVATMRQSPHMGPYLQRVKALAQFDAITCDVSYVHHV